MPGIGTATKAAAGAGGATAVNLTQVGSAAFALGQQLAAASLPVVLTAAQISTLTPPAAITGFATSANQLTEISSLATLETLVLTEDRASANADPGVQLLAVRKATPANLSSDDGDYEPLQVSAGRLWASVLVDTALPAGNNNIGDVDAVQSGTWNIGTVTTVTTVSTVSSVTAIANALPAGTNNIGDVDVASIAAGDNNIGNVDIVSGTLTTLTTLTGGGVAHDSADSGNPHKVGFKAFSPDGTTPGTAVAENDRTDAKADLDGRQFVNTKHPRFGHKHLDGTAAYTDESLVADPGDGFQVIITHINFSSGEAVAINFFLEEGSTKIFGPIYIEAVAGRGYSSGPIHLPVTASTAVTLTTSAANDQSFDMDYFIQAV